MSNVMMMIGSFQFGISTAAYQELQRTTEYRWPAQELFGKLAALQSTGPGSDQITLNGVVYAEWRGGIGQIDDLRDLAAQQVPQFLVDGRGGIMGQWVIEKVDEKQAIFAAHGTPLKQDFTISLRKFSDPTSADLALLSDIVGTASVPAFQVASAVASNAAGSMAQFTSSLTAGLAQVKSIVADVQSAVTPAIAAVKQGITAARVLQAAAVDAKNLIGSIKNINSIATAEVALGGLSRVSGQAASGASSASAILNTAVSTMTANGETEINIGIVRDAMINVNRLAVSATSTRSQSDAVVRGFSK